MLSSIKCIIIYPNATMKDCNEFDTGMAGPKSENLWSNPFVFSSTIKYLKYKKSQYIQIQCRRLVVVSKGLEPQYGNTGDNMGVLL